MSDVYTSGDGWAFVQFESGKQVYPLGSCFDADAIPDPKGDRDPIQCLGPNGEWEERGWNKTPPDKISTTLTGLQAAAASWMEKVKERGFRFNLYITEGHCNTRSVFGAWQRAYIVPDSLIVDDPVSNTLMRGATTETEHAFSVSAMPGRIDHRTVTVSRVVTVDTADLNGVQTGNDWREQSDAGPQIYNGQNIIMAAAGVAGAIPDVLISRDGLTTNTSPATGLAATTNVVSVCRFRLDCDTVREVAMRDGLAATALITSYSDDDWATTVETSTGGAVLEGGIGGQSMFCLDKDHIWMVTDDGNAWFSSDGAASWVLQTTAVTASGGAVLNAVHFADANFGVAVGAGDVIIYTLDGGENWVAGTATGTGDGLLTVHCFDSQRIIVGTNGTAATSDPIFQTWDRTAHWTATPIYDVAPAAAADDCFSLDFCNDLSGLALIGTPAGQVNVYQTIDGGYSFQRLTTPTNVQLNSVKYVTPNLAYAVGLVSTTSMILKIEG